jgi:CRP-like cAMP-binding protein
MFALQWVKDYMNKLLLDQMQPLVKTSIVRKHSKGSTILYQGEVPRNACILLKGIVRVCSISPQGDTQIVMFHVPGEFFPSSWIFEKASSTLFFYEASEDCEVVNIPKATLVDYMTKDPIRSTALLDYFTTNYSASLIRVNALEQPKARDKLIYTLYYLCQHYGDAMSNKMTIPFALSHQNLAGLVGLTRETTATEMSKLKKQGVLSYANQLYTVDKEKLLSLIGEESFKDIHLS